MRKAIICDIDGTLADCRHRTHHVKNGAKNWEAFFAEAGTDPLIVPIRDIIRAMPDYHRFLCTGRSEDQRQLTESWLDENVVPYEEMLMRPSGDFTADHLVKAKMLDYIQGLGFEVAFVIDDRQSVVNMWRERGLLCLQCRADDFEHYPDTAHLTIMVGPAGAGKTTWLKGEWGNDPMYGWACNFGIHPSHIISSDQTRHDLFGDFRHQGDGDYLFETIAEVARYRLRRGLPTVIDATNIRRKNRMEMAKLVPSTVRVDYVVINRSMEEKRATGGWRVEPALGDFMEKHDQTFNSQIKDILRGDNLPNVSVYDLRGGEVVVHRDGHKTSTRAFAL